MCVILNSSSDEHTGIGCNFHFAFAHPRRAISFISLIESFVPPRSERQPTKSEIAPSCAAVGLFLQGLPKVFH